VVCKSHVRLLLLLLPLPPTATCCQAAQLQDRARACRLVTTAAPVAGAAVGMLQLRVCVLLRPLDVRQPQQVAADREVCQRGGPDANCNIRNGQVLPNRLSRQAKHMAAHACGCVSLWVRVCRASR
jgi:hypothetical protein